MEGRLVLSWAIERENEHSVIYADRVDVRKGRRPSRASAVTGFDTPRSTFFFVLSTYETGTIIATTASQHPRYANAL